MLVKKQSVHNDLDAAGSVTLAIVVLRLLKSRLPKASVHSEYVDHAAGAQRELNGAELPQWPIQAWI